MSSLQNVLSQPGWASWWSSPLDWLKRREPQDQISNLTPLFCSLVSFPPQNMNVFYSESIQNKIKGPIIKNINRNYFSTSLHKGGFPPSSVSKESACNAADPGLMHGSGRSPGEGNRHPLQYSCLENPMHRGAWRATVHGIAKSWTWLKDYTLFFLCAPYPVSLLLISKISMLHLSQLINKYRYIIN